MAKGIGNGFPLAAVVTTPGKTAQSLPEAISHFFTHWLFLGKWLFTMNTPVCAVSFHHAETP